MYIYIYIYISIDIHHIAPYVPFYMYSTIWHHHKDDLIAEGTEIHSLIGIDSGKSA